MPNRFRALPIVFSAAGAFIVVLVFSSCYTLLKHPPLSDVHDEQESLGQCANCHSEEDIWYYHHPSTRHFYIDSGYPSWYYYYDLPWWYDAYWPYTDENLPETVPIYRRSLRSTGDKQEGLIGPPIQPPIQAQPPQSPLKAKPKSKPEPTEKQETKRKSIRPKKKKKEDG
jgi:hypothetical protein